jgi:hypothetical protein
MFSVVALLACGCVSTSQQQQPGRDELFVPGMTRYEDAEFGFSFWYPSTWNVILQPVNNCSARPRPSSCPGDSGRLQEGNIVKQLMLLNSQVGIVLQEFRSSSRSIIELGAGASPLGNDVKYSFDPTARTWMRTVLRSTALEVPLPVTSLADVSQKTMGGLPILTGAARHGSVSIVPLNPNDFVIVESIDPGNPDQRYLSRTIMTADPALPRESIATQQRVINDWRLHSENLQ